MCVKPRQTERGNTHRGATKKRDISRTSLSINLQFCVFAHLQNVRTACPVSAGRTRPPSRRRPSPMAAPGAAESGWDRRRRRLEGGDPLLCGRRTAAGGQRRRSAASARGGSAAVLKSREKRVATNEDCNGAVSPLRIWWRWFPIAIVTNTTFPILRNRNRSGLTPSLA